MFVPLSVQPQEIGVVSDQHAPLLPRMCKMTLISSLA